MFRKEISWNPGAVHSPEEAEAELNEFMREIKKLSEETQTVTLKEYRDGVEGFWNFVTDRLLVDAKEDELYHVYNTLRDDAKDQYSIGLYSKICRKMENVYELIEQADSFIMGDLEDADEEPSELYYWTIEKYRMIEGEYERIFRIHLINPIWFIKISFHYNILDFCTEVEQDVYSEWSYLCGWMEPRHLNIGFPYQKGDILKVDERPYFNQSDYYVYLGDGRAVKKDENRSVYDTHLFSNMDLMAYFSFPLCRLEVVPSCPDEMLNKIAFIVRETGSETMKEIKSKLMQEDDTGGYTEFFQRMYEREREALANIAEKNASREIISLDEYANLSKKTEKMFMSILAETPDADECYLVTSHTRYDIDVKSYAEVFHDYDKLTEYILYEDPCFHQHTKEAEPYDQVMWWRVERKKLFENSYRTTMVCEMDASCRVIAFDFGNAFHERYQNHEHYQTLCDRMSVVKCIGRKSPFVKLPYKAGDILYVDQRPKYAPQECIYLGEEHTPYGKTDHLCLIRQTFPESGKLRVVSLYGLGGFGGRSTPSFRYLEKREQALDVYLGQASLVIQKDASQIERILELAARGGYGDPDIIEQYLDSIAE